MDQKVDGLPSTAIDIVSEEIADVFRDKLEVSMIIWGQSYWKPYDNRFYYNPYP
jgi:hypothetical protein